MRSIAIAVSSVVLFLSAGLVQAMPFAAGQSQNITVSGQAFTFNFVGLPQPGTLGQFSITLNGDYSEGFPTVEGASSTLDMAGGSLVLGNTSGGNNIVSNTIAGLTLNSFSETLFSFNDWELSWVFDMTDVLLNSIINDSAATVSVTNTGGVGPFNESNPDFVAVGFAYNVPAPPPVLLLGLGLLGLAVVRRRT